ncbi:hypothetical protein BH23PLA1_BH23PLA1_12080 [soil metagenome]
MKRKFWAIALSALLPVGCSLIRPDRLPEGGLAEFRQMIGSGSTPGQGSLGDEEALVGPRRNALKVMIAARPVDDAVLRDAVWRLADEQVVEPPLRRVLEANGLRLGVVEGRLPIEVEAILDQEVAPPHRIDPVILALPDGDPEIIGVGPSQTPERLSLFLNRDGVPTGKDYQNAQGYFRMTARQDEEREIISLRIVPEIHHGAVRTRFDVAPVAGPYSPMEFVRKDGQIEESLRELAVQIPIRPNQLLVLGCWPDRPRSLGHFLLTDSEPGSDRLLQKVIFVWATPVTSMAIPWVNAISPPRQLQSVDPSEVEGLR